VFAFQNDGTVQAITSDGTTAWTANVSQALNYGGAVLPDFQGGLVVFNEEVQGQGYSIVKLDGITGQSDFVYTPPDGGDGLYGLFAVHTDGTIFAVQYSPSGLSVIGIDPTIGTQKFSVPIPSDNLHYADGLIIAGDGYAYVPYTYVNFPDGVYHTRLLRIGSGGDYSDMQVADNVDGLQMVTNADQGILLTWFTDPSYYCCAERTTYLATTTGASLSVSAALQVSDQYQVIPILQAQDGSFVGTAVSVVDGNAAQNNMISFDAAGNVRWYVPNDQPQIATADGGVIGQSGITYDQNGNATGQVGVLPVYSWVQQWYSSAGEQIAAVAQPIVEWATSYQATAGGNPSDNGTSVGVAEEVEGMPVFALPLRGGPNCQLPSGGGAQVPLGGAALQQYTSEKQQLVAGNYLINSSCSSFFSDDPIRATYLDQLTAAVGGQVPFDGVQTNISEYAAGMSDGKNPTDVKIKKVMAVCSLFVPFHGPNGVVPPHGLATAASQIVVVPPAAGPATAVYINTNSRALKSLTQGAVLHEALHNLTGLLDFVDLDWRSPYGYQPPYDLKTFVGIEPSPGVDPNPSTTNDITIQLRLKGCAGAN
jgi:hypothetical protein